MATAAAAVVSWVATAVASTVSVALGAAGLGGVAATWTVVATYYATEIALYAGLSYAIDAVQRPKAKPVGAELTFNIDPDYPREMVVGERLIGGSMVARYSKGPDRSQAHMVIQVADHPCESLLEAYGDSRLVRNTPLTHGVRTEITTYSNSGGPRVWMTWHDGRPGQTADADLVSASAQDPEVIAGRLPAWTSDHKGAGCAYVHVEVRYDSDILTSIPSFLFKVRGAKFYDRRLDTTAGGSGSHRLDDPSTWAYTTNAAVVWDHYSLGYKVEDDDLAFGIGLSKTELPYAQFAQAADLADEDVATGTGDGAETIKRYAINGVLSAATYFQDQLEDFQIQMAGRIVDLGGRIGLIGAEEKVSAVSLSDGDLVAGEPFQFAPKLQFSDLYGQVSGSFADPANNYQGTPYQTQYSEYALLPDGGEAQAVTMDLPLEVHPRRAARNISAWLARESLQPRLVGVFMPKAWKLEVGDWFDYTDEGLQVEAAMFEVVDIVKNDDFTVTITARAVDPDFLAFDNDNDPDLSVPPDVPPVDLVMDAPSGSLIAVSLSGGGATEPALRFTLASISPLAREYVIQVQQWNGSSLTGDPWTVTGHSDELVNLIRAGVLPDKQYKARIKARAGVRESAWTAWSSAVSTSATYLVPAASVGTAIVGQGALATLNGVYFGSSLIQETSGGSSATLGNFKTALGTAAAIAGQGDLATTNKATLPFGQNALTNTEFTLSTLYPPHGYTSAAPSGNVAGGSFSGSIVTAGPRRALKMLYSGTVSSGTFFDLFYIYYADPTNLRRFALPVVAGDVVGASMLMAKNAAVSQAYLVIMFMDSAGVYIGDVGGSSVTATTNGDTGNPSDYGLSSVVATAPTNTRFAAVFARAITAPGQSNPTMWGMSPMLCRLPAGQTVVPPYAPGGVDRNANRTEDNTASAIAGQGQLATLNDASTIGYASPSTGNLSTSYVSKVSKAITTDGGVVEIEFAAIFELMNPIVAESGATDVNVQCKVKRDSTELLADFVLCGWRFFNGVQYNYSKVQGRVILTDTPSAGSRTYSVELKTNVGGSDTGLVAARMVSGGNLMRILNPIGAANSVS